jgi:hypothetical protein
MNTLAIFGHLNMSKAMAENGERGYSMLNKVVA